MTPGEAAGEVMLPAVSVRQPRLLREQSRNPFEMNLIHRADGNLTHTHTQLELRGYLHCWRLILYMRTLLKHFSFYSLCFIILVTSMLVENSMICCIHVKETTIRTIPYKCKVLIKLIQLLFADYSFALFFSKTSVLQCLFTTGYLIYRRKVLSVFFDFIALYHRPYNICLVGCSDRLLLMLSQKTHLHKEV